MVPLLLSWSLQVQSPHSFLSSLGFQGLLLLKNTSSRRGALLHFHSANNSGFTKSYTGNNLKSELWWKKAAFLKSFLINNVGCFVFFFNLLHDMCHGKFKLLQVWVSRIGCTCLMCFCWVNPQEDCESRYLLTCWFFICLLSPSP